MTANQYTNQGTASYNVVIDSALINCFSNNNSDSYFKSKYNIIDNNFYKVSKNSIIVSPISRIKKNKPGSKNNVLGITSITNLKGNEFGLPNLKLIKNSLLEKNYTNHQIRNCINDLILDNVFFVGFSVTPYDFKEKSDGLIGANYRGVNNFTNFIEPISVGQKLELCILDTNNEFNNLEYKTTSSTAELYRGQVIFTLKPQTQSSLCDYICSKQKLFTFDPLLYKQIHSSYNKTSSSTFISNYKINQFLFSTAIFSYPILRLIEDYFEDTLINNLVDEDVDTLNDMETEEKLGTYSMFFAGILGVIKLVDGTLEKKMAEIYIAEDKGISNLLSKILLNGLTNFDEYEFSYDINQEYKNKYKKKKNGIVAPDITTNGGRFINKQNIFFKEGIAAIVNLIYMRENRTIGTSISNSGINTPSGVFVNNPGLVSYR